MAVGIQSGEIIKYAIIVVALYGIGYILFKFFKFPLRALFIFIGNGIIGFVLMFLINTIFASSGFFVPINGYTIVVSGVLGVPGIIMLILLKLLL
mgnify:CR=1 FL=1